VTDAVPGTRAATLDDVDRCTEVLALAFQDDPGTIVFEPDSEARRRFLPAFFRSFVLASLADGGDLVVPADGVTGVASWFGPAIHGPTLESLLANGFGDALAILGGAGAERLTAMVGEIDAQHDRRTAGLEHLRLEFFGVDPRAQGTGVGSRLADVGHRRADTLGLPCYLETFTLPNVRYYEKRGYRLVGEYPVGEGVPVYAMERPAQTGGPRSS
jgi:GNAT superfamily N-acetyltransferase